MNGPESLLLCGLVLLTAFLVFAEMTGLLQSMRDYERGLRPDRYARQQLQMRINGPMCIVLGCFLIAACFYELYQQPARIELWGSLALTLVWLWLLIRWTRRAWTRNER
jgi:hypothetical protein